MTKRQLIDEIMAVNRSADPEFLADFEDVELNRYLKRLRLVGTPRLTGHTPRYERRSAKRSGALCSASSTGGNANPAGQLTSRAGGAEGKAGIGEPQLVGSGENCEGWLF